MKMVIYKSKNKNHKPYVNNPRSQYASYQLFNKYDKAGRELCRNVYCNNLAGIHHYCSWKCRNEFVKYHRMNFTWQGVRWRVFVRDKWLCQLCGRKVNKPQADHIKPIALMKEFGYKSMTLKTFKEYIYNLDNLRTLCYTCHKKVTKNFMENINNYIQKIREKKKLLFN